MRSPARLVSLVAGPVGLWLALLGGGPAVAQPGQVEVHGESAGERRDPTAELGPGAFRTLLGDDGAVVGYTSSLDRASHVLERVEVFSWYFAKWNRTPIATAVYLLDRSEWRRAEAAGVYGLPLRVSGTMVLMPSEGDESTVAFWSDVLGDDGLMTLPGRPLVGTPAEVSTLQLADALLSVEIARPLVLQQRWFGQEAWIGEVMAHLVAELVARRHEGDHADRVSRFYERMDARLASTSSGALDDFVNSLQLGDRHSVERWLWYQGRFRRAAEMIRHENGLGAIDRLKKMVRQGEGGLTRQALVKRYPRLQEWIESFPPPAE